MIKSPQKYLGTFWPIHSKKPWLNLQCSSTSKGTHSLKLIWKEKMVTNISNGLQSHCADLTGFNIYTLQIWRRKKPSKFITARPCLSKFHFLTVPFLRRKFFKFSAFSRKRQEAVTRTLHRERVQATQNAPKLGDNTKLSGGNEHIKWSATSLCWPYWVQSICIPDLKAKIMASKFNTTLPVKIPLPDCSSFTSQIFKVLCALAEKTRGRYENVA